ncbi:MAG: glycosyltransferase family 4 protein [Bryobacterales bacterium]|nr:glycosyltransferase family 4 protein [Bryobacterales bacterium]
MRILHWDTGRHMRGGQWQVLYLVRGLRDRGHTVSLICRGELAEQAQAEAIPIGAIDKPDIVHVHDARAHTAAWLRRMRPLVVSRRVAFPVKTGMLSRWKYAAATHYVAISECVREQLAWPATVVYDGVPALDSAPGADDVLIYDKRRGDRFDIRALRSARVFVYLSEMDGLGSAALLAMSAGIPVIASNVGGLPEVVLHGETGLLVDNSKGSIEGAISRLITDRAYAAQLGRNGRLRYEQLFTVDHMVEGTLRVYRQVLE